MPKAVQLTLELENGIGTLSRLCRDLANGGVNIMGLSAPDSKGRTGPIRLLVGNRDLAEHVVGKAGYTYRVDEVLFLELKNRPGALARAVEKLARAKIDVKYVYATAHLKAQKTAVVIAVGPEKLPRAVALLG